MAFDSAASNLTPGDTNGTRDVFVDKRDGAGDLQGTLTNVSQELNTDSTNPSLSGENDHGGEVRRVRVRRQVLASVTGAGEAGSGRRAEGRRHLEFVVYSAGGTVKLGPDGGICTVAPGANPDIQTNGKGAAYVRSGAIKYLAWTPTGCDDGGASDRDGKEITADVPKTGKAGPGPARTRARRQRLLRRLRVDPDEPVRRQLLGLGRR